MPDDPAPTGAAPTSPAAAADEARHQAGGEQLWSESYYLDFFDPERGIGGYVRLGLCEGLGRAWYWGCVVGPDRPLVTVIDHDVPLPPARSLEIRTEGLWADYTVETPLDHVTVGLEAFGVGVDDAGEVYGALRGDRVPLGFDLEWETDGGTYAYPGVTRYEVPCRVHGEVLVGDERIELDGFGQRDHSWGVRDWWSMAWSWTAGRLDDGTRFHGTSVDIDGTPIFGTGYVQPPGGALVGTDRAERGQVLGAHGFPTSATWRVGDLDLELEPVAFSPVLLEAPDGRTSRFPRAWTTFRAADGRTGHGWTEWNQPQPG
ncbi:MAG TPA: hypothetical protein VHK88_17040 [Aquihabitans sp.]|nr:hypothetical protein [Aquihabitans sp.]